MASLSVKYTVLSAFFIGFAAGIRVEGIDVKLEKVPNEEFNFEYKLRGETFRGETIHVHQKFYLVFGEENIYGVTVPDEQFNSTSSFFVFAPKVDRSDEELVYRDNMTIFRIDIPRKWISVAFYFTEWDKNNTCFKKSPKDDNTFEYLIESNNNGRLLLGETYFESDPKQQELHVEDQCPFHLTFDFTESELRSKKRFCKAPTSKFHAFGYQCPMGAHGGPLDINSKVLMTLVG